MRTLLLLLALFFLIDFFSLQPYRETKPTSAPLTLTGISHYKGQFPIKDIVQTANDLGLDFVILSETSQKAVWEKRHGKVDLFFQSEVLQKEGDVLDFGQFRVALHPNHPDRPWAQLLRLPKGIEGIDLGSLLSLNYNTYPLSTLSSIYLFPLHNYLFATRTFTFDKKMLQFWDTMNVLEPGHFLTLGTTELRFNTRKAFSIAQYILFLKQNPALDFKERRKQIYYAMEQGQSAIVFGMHHPFPGNEFRIQCSERIYRSGDHIRPPYPASCSAIVETPATLPFPHLTRILRNGEIIAEYESSKTIESFSIPGQSGNYRAEIWLKAKTLFQVFYSNKAPYLFYNPIYFE